MSTSDASGELSEQLLAAAATMQVDVGETITMDPTEMDRQAHAAFLPVVSLAFDDDADLKLGETLGRGGGGQVRLARQQALHRDVAVKTLPPSNERPEVANRLVQEGILTGQLEHPNIVPIHLLGQDENAQPVLVMKRVEGVPWSRVDEQEQLEADQRLLRHLEIFLEVCKAVSFAHARGVLHRDIKPANVMTGAFGEVYLLDWGISTAVGTAAFAHAKPGQQRVPLGTPVYMAPEMCISDGVLDERTDVYLLGATLHRVLARTPRHQATSLIEALRAALRSEPFPYHGEIPAELATLCNKATARRPSERYSSVLELAEAVRAYLRHRSSIELAREAEELLGQLERAEDTELAESERQRLFTECRFAFVHARREWEENPRVAIGLQRCLEAMIGAELAADRVDAALAHLAELPRENAKLRAACAEALRRRELERAQAADLRKLSHELDPTISKGSRAVFAILIAALNVTMVGSILFTDRPVFALDPSGALQSVGPFALLFGAAALFFRRKLFATALNRRIMLLVGIAIAGTALNRAVAIIAQPPFEYMLGVDILLLAILAALASGSVDRAFAGPAVIWAAGFVAIVLLPQTPMVPYGIAQIGGLIALAVSFYRRRKAETGITTARDGDDEARRPAERQ